MYNSSAYNIMHLYWGNNYIHTTHIHGTEGVHFGQGYITNIDINMTLNRLFTRNEHIAYEKHDIEGGGVNLK